MTALARYIQTLLNSLLSIVTASAFAGAALALTPLDYQTESHIFDALEKAHGLISADRYNEAKPLLESAARHDPSRYSGTLHENLAMIYRELGYPEKGILHAKIAQSYGGSPGTFYTMGLCYSDMGEFKKAEDAFQRFIIESPDQQFRQQAADIIRDLQDDSHKVKAGQSKKRDYFDDIVENKEAQKWKQGLLPLKLYIDSGKGVKNYRPSYRRLILEALDAWCSASGNKLSYKLVNDKAQADVVVEWVGQAISTVQKDRKRDAAGLTTCDTDDKQMISHALIQIETYDFDHSAQAADSKIKSACLHEIGHAIGVGHSPYVKDIMYFKLTPRQLFSLSPRDRATAARLYQDYPVVTLVTGTSSLPPECFAQPTLPPGALRYPPIPPSFFAQPPLPPKKDSSDSASDVSTSSSRSSNASLFAQPTAPKTSGTTRLPSVLFAQPSLPPPKSSIGGKQNRSVPKANKTVNRLESPANLFATPSLPPRQK
ncbi:MAG: matrixin family metalloprotease [Cyanobacteria bacterium SZAS LIN-5]|nr:matrixin family metalloprotease [Cyanobacteria bacterium SZAS LIN-5]